jgi:hypothetical protein
MPSVHDSQFQIGLTEVALLPELTATRPPLEAPSRPCGRLHVAARHAPSGSDRSFDGFFIHSSRFDQDTVKKPPRGAHHVAKVAPGGHRLTARRRPPDDTAKSPPGVVLFWGDFQLSRAIALDIWILASFNRRFDGLFIHSSRFNQDTVKKPSKGAHSLVTVAPEGHRLTAWRRPPDDKAKSPARGSPFLGGFSVHAPQGRPAPAVATPTPAAQRLTGH